MMRFYGCDGILCHHHRRRRQGRCVDIEVVLKYATVGINSKRVQYKSR